MAAILSSITSMVTEAISWVSSFVTEIVGSPLLLLFTLVSFIGLGVGLIRRIIR